MRQAIGRVLSHCSIMAVLYDSRNILIIQFRLLLKESTLDSIGHDLCKKYNVIYLLWMIRYISLLTNAITQWILIGA